MSNTIQPGTLKHLQSLGSSKSADSAADVDAGGVDRGDRPGVADSGDSVKLTDSAKALNAASKAGDSSGVVDAGRVDKVRQALADGSYKVDAGRIADKLIAMEKQIAGKG